MVTLLWWWFLLLENYIHGFYKNIFLYNFNIRNNYVRTKMSSYTCVFFIRIMFFGEDQWFLKNYSEMIIIHPCLSFPVNSKNSPENHRRTTLFHRRSPDFLRSVKYWPETGIHRKSIGEIFWSPIFFISFWGQTKTFLGSKRFFNVKNILGSKTFLGPKKKKKKVKKKSKKN